MASRINNTTLEIKPRQPFDFARTVYSHGWVNLLPNRWDTERKIFRRLEQLDGGKVVLIAARGSRSIKKAVITLDVAHAGKLSAAEQAAVIDRISHMLRIDEDFSEFHQLCGTRGERWAQVSRGAGRLLRSPHLFEDLVKTICTTNVQWSGTCRMVEQLVAIYGAPYPVDISIKTFPTPHAIAAVPLAKFKQSVNLGYRSDYVHLLATRIASGDLDLATLTDRTASTQEIKKRLLAIKGIGNYAAATLLMLLGRYDQLPVDSVFRQFVSNNYFAGADVDDAAAQAIYADWGDWKYLAYWSELWRDVTDF